MPRVGRNALGTTYFHIMVQGNARETIFENREDKEKYKYLLFKNSREQGVDILAYCIMDNHTHILVKSSEQEKLSKFMTKANTSYAMYYNKEKNRVGYVFRDRYKSEPVYEEKHLVSCLVYIHKNPVKAGLVNHVEDYEFSSFQDFFKEESGVSFDSVKEIVGAKNFAEYFEEIHQKTYAEEWVNYKEKDYEKVEKIIKEYEKKAKRKLDKILKDDDLLIGLSKELQKRAGLSGRDIAKLLGIGRETLRRLLAMSNSD